jgi:hypothetical protein
MNPGDYMSNFFSPIFGLVTASDPTTENGGSHFAKYLVLKILTGTVITKFDRDLFTDKMYASYVGPGLYLRSEHHTERTVSQDEITGMIFSSDLLGTWHDRVIWKRLVDGFGSYPATKTAKYYNPGSYYSWAIIAESKLSTIFLPVYIANLLISTNKEAKDTSSKLIYFVELFVLKDKCFIGKILSKYYVWRMKKMYGPKWIKSLFAIYYIGESEDHPLIHLSREAEWVG